MTDYAAYRQEQFALGLLYQDFIADLLLCRLGFPVVQYASQTYQQTFGESRSGVEIKFQGRLAETGNLWIEVGEKAHPRPGDYAPSGITARPYDNAWLWVTGDFEHVYGLAVSTLRLLKPRYTLIKNKTETSIGFLLSSADAQKYAAFVLAPTSPPPKMVT